MSPDKNNNIHLHASAPIYGVHVCNRDHKIKFRHTRDFVFIERIDASFDVCFHFLAISNAHLFVCMDEYVRKMSFKI